MTRRRADSDPDLAAPGRGTVAAGVTVTPGPPGRDGSSLWAVRLRHGQGPPHWQARRRPANPFQKSIENDAYNSERPH